MDLQVQPGLVLQDSLGIPTAGPAVGDVASTSHSAGQ